MTRASEKEIASPELMLREACLPCPQERRRPLRCCCSTLREMWAAGAVWNICSALQMLSKSLFPAYRYLLFKEVLHRERHLLFHQLSLSPVPVSCRWEAPTEDWEAPYCGFSLRSSNHHAAGAAVQATAGCKLPACFSC